MKFIVDCMLGKLAKWLKILGFDVVYFNKIEDLEILSLAAQEKRILLTRDNSLIQRAKSIEKLFINSENWAEQVEEVLNHFKLWKKLKPYTRCLECNIPLKEIPKKKAKNLVTPFVYQQGTTFAICPQCDRVYWQGTHFQKMEDKLKAILNRKGK
ncbi:MAG: Mut7-C RNAse domain-containing protein [Candidatus Aminicenantia bacterium]